MREPISFVTWIINRITRIFPSSLSSLPFRSLFLFNQPWPLGLVSPISLVFLAPFSSLLASPLSPPWSHISPYSWHRRLIIPHPFLFPLPSSIHPSFNSLSSHSLLIPPTFYSSLIPSLLPPSSRSLTTLPSYLHFPAFLLSSLYLPLPITLLSTYTSFLVSPTSFLWFWKGGSNQMSISNHLKVKDRFV